MATDPPVDEDHHSRRGLPGLGRLVSEPLADLAAAAAYLRRVLPEIASDLKAIHRHVASMDPEMVGMHSSVERIEGEMAELRRSIQALAGQMEGVEAAVGRLEPHVADVSLVMRPLRRARARLPRRDRVDGSEEPHGLDGNGQSPDPRAGLESDPAAPPGVDGPPLGSEPR